MENDPVVDMKEISNGTLSVRVRIRQSGEVILDAPRGQAKRTAWIATQMYFNSLRVVFKPGN